MDYLSISEFILSNFVISCLILRNLFSLQPAVLFNNGPTSLGFVIILEEGGVAQEIKDGDDKALPRALSSCITASPNQVLFGIEDFELSFVSSLISLKKFLGFLPISSKNPLIITLCFYLMLMTVFECSWKIIIVFMFEDSCALEWLLLV